MGAFGAFPASGKQMDLVIIGMHRFEGALVSETWTSWPISPRSHNWVTFLQRHRSSVRQFYVDTAA